MKTAANKKITIQAVRSLHPREALLCAVLELFAGVVNNSQSTQTIVNDNGGSTIFFGTPTAGNVNLVSLVNMGATTSFDISRIDTTGMTVGSIAGDGTFFLGSKNLTVGGN